LEHQDNVAAVGESKLSIHGNVVAGGEVNIVILFASALSSIILYGIQDK
jgi:hypothetical protein